jgi:hypothetical protein
MRVWVDNELVLDAWSPSTQTVWGIPKNLTKDQKYPLRVEINFPATQDAEASRIFSAYVRSSGGTPSQQTAVLPRSQLYCGTNPACDINPGVGQTPIPTPQPDPDPEPEPEPPAPPADTTAPNVSITAPANNASVSGSVTVNANASDNVGVTRVEFYSGGSVLRATDTNAPYSFSLTTSQLTNGQHTLTARAFDAAGNARTSSAVTITVNNVTAPPPEPTPPPRVYEREDVNQDGRVDIRDFALWAIGYGKTGSNLGRADVNGDGRINIQDFAIMSIKYGRSGN